MNYFYGVYLDDSDLAATLDLVRFLAEPDGIRFSHVTIRGPLTRKIPSDWLAQQNANASFDWKIMLTKPGRFMADAQATVFIHVDLGTLAPLWQKPNFPNGTPHMTLYDGKSQEFATKLRNVLSHYDFNCWAHTTKLRPIQKKFKVDEVFHASFEHFYKKFEEHVGDVKRISQIRYATDIERIKLIEVVLAGSFRAPAQERKRA